jgi:hypothetical protein
MCKLNVVAEELKNVAWCNTGPVQFKLELLNEIGLGPQHRLMTSNFYIPTHSTPAFVVPLLSITLTTDVEHGRRKFLLSAADSPLETTLLKILLQTLLKVFLLNRANGPQTAKI